MSNRERILGIIAILILGLSTFVSNHAIFILLSAIAIYLGVSQFLIDKKEQGTALNYCRKDWIIWRSMLRFTIAIAFIYFPPLIGFNDLFDNPVSFYVFSVFIGGTFASVHQNFFNSIRSYSQGFKMPGRKSPLIPWEEVAEMRIIEESIEIKFQNNSEKLNIDRRDLKYLPKIVLAWEKRKV